MNEALSRPTNAAEAGAITNITFDAARGAMRMGAVQHFTLPQLASVAAGRSMSTTSEPGIVGNQLQDVIHALKPYSLAARLGVLRVLPRGTGTVSIPTMEAAAVEWLDEDQAGTEQVIGTGALAQIEPHTLTAQTVMTRRLVKQAGTQAAAEALMQAIGAEIDRVLLLGAGGLEPVGLTSKAGASVAVGAAGADINPVKIAELIQKATEGGADVANCAFIAGPAATGKLMTDTTATNGKPCGLTVYSHKDVSELFFGDFRFARVFIWDGIDLVIDNQDEKGRYHLRAFADCDVAFVQPSALVKGVAA